MKYIKTFENKELNLHLMMCDFLSKINDKEYLVTRFFYYRGMTEGNTLAFKRYENYPRENTYPIFSITFKDVNDTKLRGVANKPKMKVIVNYEYDMAGVKDVQFVSMLKDFIVDVFTKYSYFHKKRDKYYRKDFCSHDFYINTSEISNIMNDFENEFDFYVNTRKYNL
jgi:hypothetical protein